MRKLKPHEFIMQVWSMNKPADGAHFFLAYQIPGHKRMRQAIFKWPIGRNKVRLFIKEHIERHHLFFCPSPFMDERRLKDRMMPTCWMWSDLDHNKDLTYPASVYWRTSPKSSQAMWLLDDVHTTMEVGPVNQKLNQLEAGDGGGGAMAKLLRIPGTTNFKKKYQVGTRYPRVRLLMFNKRPRPISDFKIVVVADKASRNKAMSLCRSKGVPERIIHMVGLKSLKKEEDRSSRLRFLCRSLFEYGINRENIIALLTDSVWNKFQDSRPEELEADVDRNLEGIEETGPVGLSIVSAGRVRPGKQEWLIDYRIPLHEITFLEGATGVGKSSLIIRLISDFSSGRRMGTRGGHGRLNILVIQTEGHLENSFVPRLIACGADMDRIKLLNASGSEETLHLDEQRYVDWLKDQLVAYDTNILIIDPLLQFAGDIDFNRGKEAPNWLNMLQRMCREMKITGIFTRHWTKNSENAVLYRGGGVVGMTGVVRAQSAVIQDPNDEDKKYWVTTKMNEGARSDSLPMSYYTNKDLSVDWGKIENIDIEGMSRAAVNQNEATDHRKEMDDFVKSSLNGKGMTHEQLMKQAEVDGRSPDEVERSMKRLNIIERAGKLRVTVRKNKKKILMKAKKQRESKAERSTGEAYSYNNS